MQKIKLYLQIKRKTIWFCSRKRVLNAISGKNRLTAYFQCWGGVRRREQERSLFGRLNGSLIFRFMQDKFLLLLPDYEVLFHENSVRFLLLHFFEPLVDWPTVAAEKNVNLKRNKVLNFKRNPSEGFWHYHDDTFIYSRNRLKCDKNWNKIENKII